MINSNTNQTFLPFYIFIRRHFSVFNQRA